MCLKNAKLQIFEHISKLPQKVSVLGLFSAILQNPSPLLEQKGLFSLQEKFDPPCRPFFYPPPAAHHHAQVCTWPLLKLDTISCPLLQCSSCLLPCSSWHETVFIDLSCFLPEECSQRWSKNCDSLLLLLKEHFSRSGPCTVFWVCIGKNFVSKGVCEGKNFVSKGVCEGKNFVSLTNCVD